MIVGIPSYKRAGKVKTLKFLQGAFSKDELIIATQTEEEFQKYSELYGEEATVIFAEAHSCGEARNNILNYCEANGIKEILFLDDDISFLVTISDKKLYGNEFRKLMEDCFDFCRKNNVTLFGSYAVANSFFMKNSVKRNMIDGMLCGLLDTSVRYDIKFTTKSDYELSLRLMSKGKRVIRFNNFAPQADARSKGGCEEIRARKEEYFAVAELLLQAYPTLIKAHPTRKGEVKFIG